MNEVVYSTWTGKRETERLEAETETDKQYVICCLCGYEKEMGQPCGEPCV